eukprot:728032_1
MFLNILFISMIYPTLADLSCNISGTNTNYIVGNRYYSLSGPNTSVHCDSVQCEGTRSCNDVLDMSVRDNLSCFGDHSCSHLGDVEYITIGRSIYGYNHGPNRIYCYGANSCSLSTLAINSSCIDSPSCLDYLYCQGYKSCGNSRFYGVPTLYASGAYSLMNSNIINSTAVYLWGYYSGYNSTIVSDPNNPCTVKCQYIGCVFRNVTCLGTCAIDLNLLFNAPNVIDYDYECINHTPPCCTSSESCQNEAISMDFDNTLHVICGAFLSCLYSNITNRIGPIICSGSAACAQSHINTTDAIYCLGKVACDSIAIYSAMNVTCAGMGSCAHSVIHTSGLSNNHYFYFIGKDAGYDSKIHCETGAGYYSCTDFTCSGSCEYRTYEWSMAPTQLTRIPSTSTTTATPITPAPITPAPITPAPITPAPITPHPATQNAFTPAPSVAVVTDESSTEDALLVISIILSAVVIALGVYVLYKFCLKRTQEVPGPAAKQATEVDNVNNNAKQSDDERKRNTMCDLWGVSSSEIDVKVRALKSIIGDLPTATLLDYLVKCDLNVDQCINLHFTQSTMTPPDTDTKSSNDHHIAVDNIANDKTEPRQDNSPSCNSDDIYAEEGENSRSVSSCKETTKVAKNKGEPDEIYEQ